MKKIIVTIGPSLLDNHLIRDIHTKNYIYRINGAHGDIHQIERYIQQILTEVPNAEVLLDLPGNKIRLENLNQPLQLKQLEKFTLSADQINYPDFYHHLKKGDVVWANDSIFKFIVHEVDRQHVVFESHSDGVLTNNKGLHVRGIHHGIPFLFQKDKELLELAGRHRLSYLGLSFVRNIEDILEVRNKVDSSIQLISKIETAEAVRNIDSILNFVDYVLVDRGDLSTEVGLSKVPSYQKYIVERGLFFNKKVFLATQFLKTMEVNPIPTIAEVIDLYNTLKMGVYGIQLSEETAIGAHPVKCLSVIHDLLNEIVQELKL